MPVREMLERVTGKNVLEILKLKDEYLCSLAAEFASSAAENAKTAKKSVNNVIDTITKKSEDSNTKFQASIKRNIDLSKKKIDELLGNYPTAQRSR